jgi:hypothetical protein
MDIDKLTYGEIKEIAKLASGTCKTSGNTHSIPSGCAVFVRTVTHYYTGHVDAVTDSDVVLSSAAWIADTGRFSDALKSGEFSEVEPYPDSVRCIVSRGAILDVSTWAHALPRKRK